MTSYRSVEAVDWFGFSQLWSLTVGLCENHKPNRFYKSKENAYKGLPQKTKCLNRRNVIANQFADWCGNDIFFLAILTHLSP